MSQSTDPTKKYPRPPFPEQEQQMPGLEVAMNPIPDHGEQTYKGTGRLKGKTALITGADSGIGKAVAIAFAREGCNIVISYLNEHEDANDTEEWVRKAGVEALVLPGDISDEMHCKKMVEQSIEKFQQIHILVNNAAYQMSHHSLSEISSQEFDYTFKTNVYAMFYLCRALEQHFKPGCCVINTSSVNAYSPSKQLMPYAVTKGAIQNFTSLLAQMWGEKGIRVNCVAPGPVWTPLIPASFPADKTKDFGMQTPLKRAAQPAELAPVYVLLASGDGSYINGATFQVTGGMPTI